MSLLVNVLSMPRGLKVLNCVSLQKIEYKLECEYLFVVLLIYLGNTSTCATYIHMSNQKFFREF
jgi:hypothetical protein